MDLKQLRYFVRIAELGGFARAADLLGVAQPTLSRQVRALEIEVKSSLFYRTGRGIVLTPAGARFLNQAHGLLHAADAALQELHRDDDRLSGRVLCGMTPSVGRLITREYVARFRKQLPLATLSITS
ncbi:MAG: LysR family transcriptional regulator, partial [Polaromonas sp.]|nr:LysR family transcriptional regulator [Polaromonas sp.]